MTRDEIVLSVAEGVLTISGEKRVESSSSESGCYRVERAYGSFHRSILVPGDVDRDRVVAVFTVGVLKVTLPKTDAGSGARKVPIH
jgi:HSP20 family protein